MPDGHRRIATYEDLCAVPDHLIAEIIDGALLTQPRPGPRHQLGISVLSSELIGPFQLGRGGSGGWWILYEPEIHLEGQVFVPDLAGWRRERLPSLPDDAYFDCAPDWICEALSPSTARIDRGRKSEIYAEIGVSWYWILDPHVRLLEVFELTDGKWLRRDVFVDKAKVAAPPFEAVTLDLALLWGDPDREPDEAGA